MKKKARQARQTIKNVDEAVLKAVNRTFFPYLLEDFPAMPGGGKETEKALQMTHFRRKWTTKRLHPNQQPVSP